MSIESAIRDAALSPAELDARGLLPVAQARALLAAATAVERENLDQLWAALVSLEDGDDLLASSRHLEWHFPPRGRDNTALVERYGAGALGWLASRQEHGVLVNHPWCVVPCVLALDAPGALELLLGVAGVAADGGDMKAWVFERDGAHSRSESFEQDALRLVLEWTRLHVDQAFPVLARLARSHPRAAAALRAMAETAPADVAARLAAAGEPGLGAELGLDTRLTAAAILKAIDQASGDSWPVFNCGVDGRMEYFGQRLIAARAREGDGWGVVIERLQGCDPDSFSIDRYAYGPGATNGVDFDHRVELSDAFTFDDSDDERPLFHGCRVTGPAGELVLDESLFARHDLRPGWDTECGGWPARTLAVRAYLAEHPDAFWPPPEDALAAAGVEGGEILLVSRAYQHPSSRLDPDGEDKPWHVMPAEAPAIRSLCEALIAHDPALFVPGEPNLDWRLHANEQNDFRPPWSEHRAATGRGYLGAAMIETGARLDERGLLPLEQARAILAAATTLERGAGRQVGERWVWDGDRVWAALLSLDTPAEAATALGKLALLEGPRDADKNVALLERYGDDCLAVVAARRRDDGAVEAASPCLRATVLGVASPAAFHFLWDLGGWAEPGVEQPPNVQNISLFAAWVNAHPSVGFVELARVGMGGDDNALAFLRAWAAPQSRRVLAWLREGLGEAAALAAYERIGLSARLVPAHVLGCLDSWAKQATQNADAWPLFCSGQGPGREYHALRLIVARQAGGDDWVVILERCEGYGQSLAVQRYVYAEHLPSGRREDLKVSRFAELGAANLPASPARLIEAADYWTKLDNAPAQVGCARALLAQRPELVWPDATALLGKLGFAGAPLVVSTAFTHTEGPARDAALPSATPSYASLAAAIVAANPKGFVPGESNLDPALHFRAEEEEDETEDETEDD